MSRRAQSSTGNCNQIVWWPCSLTHNYLYNWQLYIFACCTHEKSIIFFRRGWCKCPSVKFGLYSNNGLHPFGPKSNIYGTLTTVLIHRDPVANFLAILPYEKKKKKKTRVGDQMIVHWKNGSVNMPVWDNILTPLYIDPGVNISYDILTPGSIYRNDISTPLTIFWPPFPIVHKTVLLILTNC